MTRDPLLSVDHTPLQPETFRIFSKHGTLYCPRLGCGFRVVDTEEGVEKFRNHLFGEEPCRHDSTHTDVEAACHPPRADPAGDRVDAGMDVANLPDYFTVHRKVVERDGSGRTTYKVLALRCPHGDHVIGDSAAPCGFTTEHMENQTGKEAQKAL